MANGFIFKGSLDPNNKEPLFKYRLGKYRHDWLSDEARSLQELVFDTRSRSKAIDPKTKKRMNHLVILVERASKLNRWFELLKNPKHGFDTLRIHVYNDQNQSLDKTQFVFYNFKKSGEPEGHNPGLLFTFEYEDMNVHGAES